MLARQRFVYAVVSLCVALVGVASRASARDLWTNPYPGVRHLHRVLPTVDMHVMVVDLGSPEVSVVVTRPEDRALTVREFARRYDADIAVNANYFDWNSKTCGLAAGDGVLYGDAYEEGCAMSVGFGRMNEALAFDSWEALRGPLPTRWMTDVVSGKPWLIRNGVLQGGWFAPRHIEFRHPRTAIGLSRDKRTLFMLVADGRRADARGLNGNDLVETMAELGAWDALNLDGGGSSELYVKREGGVQNHPPSGRARIVSNHIGIRVRRGAQWFAGMLEEVSPVATLAPGARATVWARWRNTGRMPWTREAVRLHLADGARSPLYDPTAWLSDDVPSQLDRVVMPGERATFQFTVAAPELAGRYEARVVPTLAGRGPLPVAEARVELAVEERLPRARRAPATQAHETPRPRRRHLVYASADVDGTSRGWYAPFLAAPLAVLGVGLRRKR